VRRWLLHFRRDVSLVLDLHLDLGFRVLQGPVDQLNSQDLALLLRVFNQLHEFVRVERRYNRVGDLVGQLHLLEEVQMAEAFFTAHMINLKAFELSFLLDYLLILLKVRLMVVTLLQACEHFGVCDGLACKRGAVTESETLGVG
jgi:hypothetical protein